MIDYASTAPPYYTGANSFGTTTWHEYATLWRQESSRYMRDWISSGGY